MLIHKIMKKGLIITHTSITIAGIVASGLVAYYAALMGIQSQFSILTASVSGLSATVEGYGGDIMNLTKQVNTADENTLLLSEHLGFKTN